MGYRTKPPPKEAEETDKTGEAGDGIEPERPDNAGS